MWSRFRQKNPVARSITQLVALVLVAAGCAGTSGSSQSSSATYSITVHQSQQTSGLGPPTDRQITFTATVVEHEADKSTELLDFSPVSAQGDPALGTAAQTLNNQVFTVTGAPSQVTLGGSDDVTEGGFDTGIGILNPGETVLTFQLLAPTAARHRTVELFPADSGAGSRLAVPVDDTITGIRKERGIETEQITTTASADKQLPSTTAYFRDLGGKTYAADATFQQLFGAPPTVAIPTQEGTITVPGYTYGSPLGGLSGFIGGLFCIFSLGSVCPESTTVTVPPTTTTGPVPVPGPAYLMTSVTANLTLTSSQLVARDSGTLLMAAGSGHMEVSGSLPSGSSIPAELNGKSETVISDVTYSSQLLSPWPHRTSTDRDLALQLAGILALLVVGAATVVLAASGYRRLVSPR